MTVVITYRLSDNFRFIISNSVKSYKECTLYIVSIESDLVYSFILTSHVMEGQGNLGVNIILQMSNN